jgi:general secretion pathway protein K
MKQQHNRVQRGVAVITALLLTTLAITIVASLFWQQQVQVRSIENQRLQLQKQWILRGALDWARLILREDAKYSAIDDLSEPWAVPLSDTKLDQYVEEGDAGSAVLSGAIQDAQARFNLTALANGGEINQAEVSSFERLLTALHQDPGLARATAQQVAASQRQTTPSGTGGDTGGNASGNAARAIGFAQVDDLLAVPGFTPQVLRPLRDYVIFLPRVTAINANTASAEVLSAKLAPLSVSDANALIASRRNSSFRDLNDLTARLPGTQLAVDGNQVNVSTHYFLVEGRVTIRQAALQVQGLIERNGANTQLIWVREI